MVRRNRYKLKKKIKELEERNKKLHTKMEKYKKRLSRLKKTENSQETPRKAAKRQMNTGGRNTFRKLLFAEAVSQQINENFKNQQSHIKKREMAKVLSGKIVKKYRLLNTLKRLTSQKMFAKYNENSVKLITRKELVSRKLRVDVTQFLESDKASRLCSGKKETVNRNKQKIQKRYLNESLYNLHQIFKKEFPEHKISYQTFCRLRPFWILFPKASDRETCLCKIHENLRLLVRKLNTLNIINEKSSSDVLNALCCNLKSELCLDRKCNECQQRYIKINEFEDEPISFQKWVTQKVPVLIKGNMKQCTKTLKVDIQSTKKKLVNIFFRDLVPFLKHVCNIVHQYEETTKIKRNLAKNEVLIHIDFSENYVCKYNREIQSAHFGGSKPQVTIHTCVVYCHSDVKPTPISFGTISECNRHDAAAVIAHLLCLKEEIKSYVPDLAKVHFLSDGPSAQYKNKTMFQLIGCYLAPKFDVNEIHWHYCVSSHGKGAPDGVGAVLKRTADKLVAHMMDIPNCEKLVTLLQEHCKTVHVKKLGEASINDVDVFVPEGIRAFKGTMKIHEVVFKKSQASLQLRSRTCTTCRENDCKHYHLGTVPVMYPSSSSNKLSVDNIYTDSEEEKEQDGDICEEIKPNNYVLIKLAGKKSDFHFIGLIVSDESQNNDFSVKFMKKISSNKFIFEDERVWTVDRSDIIAKLAQPLLNNREQYVFDDITNFSIVIN